MHILYVSQYFPPEMGAPAARVFELSRLWVRKGHRVTILTGFPNHPDGIIPPQYRKSYHKGTITEDFEGIRVVRTWLYPVPNRYPIERIANYISFWLSSSLRGVFLSKPDIIIGTSPQLLSALTGWFLGHRFRCPFIFEVRDLWPESLPASGISHKNSVLYKTLENLARFLYKSADHIVLASPSFTDDISSWSSLSKMTVVENGVDTKLFKPLPNTEPTKHRIGEKDRFIVSYIGTIGYAQGLNTMLQAAAILKNQNPEIMFLFVGEGAERKKLEEKSKAERLTNVHFVGAQPREKIPSYIGASDVCVVLLRRSSLFEKVLPSKMLEFMACARPIIVGVGGLSKSIMEESAGGIVITPEDPSALANAITNLRKNPSKGVAMGINGQRFVVENYSREEKSEKYLRVMNNIIQNSHD